MLFAKSHLAHSSEKCVLAFAIFTVTSIMAFLLDLIIMVMMT